MSDIPSLATKIQQEQVQFRSAVSESLGFDVGGSVNYLLDQVAALFARRANIVVSSPANGSNGVIATLPPITKTNNSYIHVFGVPTSAVAGSGSLSSGFTPVGTGTNIAQLVLDIGNTSSPIGNVQFGDVSGSLVWPHSTLNFIDQTTFSSAGTFTYIVQGPNVNWANLTIIAHELLL